MTLWDWLIVIVPLAFVMGMGIYSTKYIKGVADFLSAGRVAGRYVMSMGDLATALSIIGLVAYVEVQYKTGFALVFWDNVRVPLGIVMSLYGFCIYRFRETKAMSLGQFLEMRYNRPFRVFAATLRSVTDVLANMIMPAVAARFFIYFLDIPQSFNICGFEISSFILIVLLCLVFAISLICCGGTLTILITDALQGMILFPLMLVFVVFILYKFDWGTQMVPVMSDRAVGESFLNPYDISNLRDFNLMMVFLAIVVAIFHRASWIGAGFSTAAKTPHEQKMAGVLGTWRGSLNLLFYVLIAVGIITIMNHTDFSGEAKKIRTTMGTHIAAELVAPENRADFIGRINAVPEQKHQIGKDTPLSQEKNLDTPTLNTAHEAFKEYEGEAKGNAKFQEFRTLYHQLMLATSMKIILPPVIMGMFLLLLILAMISTDVSSIFSASLTFSQDVVLPFCKKGISPQAHLRLLRLASVGVGFFYLLGSTAMSQLDYINLFVTLMTMMWLGGCGPVMLFGLYSKFGNAAGAFASVGSGAVCALASIFLQRNWADMIYPWLVRMQWADGIGSFLETISSPLNPYVVWKMDPVKFPINAYELYLMTMIFTLAVFCIVSWITQKEPFNLERMLHRGIYNTDNENKAKNKFKLSWKALSDIMLGITPEYTLGDKIIAWGVFIYSFIYRFVIAFVLVVIWNMISPWPLEWWGHYFLITALVIPGIISFISIFWFGIGGVIDMFNLFRDLELRVADNLDNGQVEGHVSLADKKIFEEREKANQTTQ